MNWATRLTIAGVAISMGMAPIAASAQTRPSMSPVFNNSPGLTQGRANSDSGQRSDNPYVRDGRTWNESRGVWIDGDGDRWVLIRNKWYPLRDRGLPIAILTAIGGLILLIASSGDNAPPVGPVSQSPGAN